MAITVTLRSLLTGAYLKNQAIGLGDSLPPNLLVQGQVWANQMIDGWGLEPGTIPFESREVFALTAGKGGTGTPTPTSGPYTIGPGGEFDTMRPEWVTNCGLLQLSSSPAVEIPRTLLTDRAYQAIAIKDLASTYFTSVYYNATYPLGLVALYPVPNTTTNSLVLYSRQPVQAFTSLDTAYVFPPGYAQVIEDNLAIYLADGLGAAAKLSTTLMRRAAQGLSNLKRANLPGIDMGLDPALTESARRPWNILSDS